MRVELKYCVPEDVATHVGRIASLFLRPDREAADERQAIASLYLDTPSLTFLRWHLDGVPERFKLRVRAYGAAPHPIVYAEVKRKSGVIGRKRRARVSRCAMQALLDRSGPPFTVWNDCEETSALHEFVWRTVTLGAEPRVLTRSIRESWRGGRRNETWDETAVTVDRVVTFRPAGPREILCPGDGWQPLPLPQHAGRTTAVLELKHGTHPPAWMASLVRELAPWRTSYSKYVVAMKCLHPWLTS